MCGRFAQISSSKVYAELFAAEATLELTPRYNLAPSQAIAMVRRGESGRRELVQVRWGLVPAWSAGPDSRFTMINARAETVQEKPAFRGAWQSRRCLIPSEGFYEWQSQAGVKQPFFIRMRDGKPFAMAGLWERWHGAEGTWIDSCAVIVSSANALVAEIHDRMPVILPSSHWDAWLDPNQKGNPTLLSFLRPSDPAVMEMFMVSRRVNNPRQDDADIITPLIPAVGDIT